MRNLFKSLFILFVTCLSIVSFSYASKIYVDVPHLTGLTYNCPFDAYITIDSQSKDIMWASLRFELSSWLSLIWVSFADTFNMSFPPVISWSNILAYGYKFPWVVSWILPFLTIRLSQSNVGTTSSKLNLLWKWTGVTDDFVDVYYFWWADSLTQIDNKDFVFTTWPCLSPGALPSDLLAPSFNPAQHMAAIQQMIDDYQHPKLFTLLSFLQTYIYIVIGFVVLLITWVLWYLTWRKKRKHTLAASL